MIKSPFIQQQQLAAQLAIIAANNKKAGNYVKNAIAPKLAERYGPGGALTQNLQPSANKIPVETPAGSPQAPVNLATGLPIPADVDIHLDFLSTAGGTKENEIILWDEGEYYKNYNNFGGNPAGSVYINSPIQNLYKSFVSELCDRKYHYAGMKVRVVASTDPSQQFSSEDFFNRHIEVSRFNAHPSIVTFPIKVVNYEDPAQFNTNLVMVQFGAEEGMVDRRTAWKVTVPDGLKVTLSLFTLAASD